MTRTIQANDDDDNTEIIKHGVVQALKIMVPVESNEWVHTPTIYRGFTQREYEVIRDVLSAYLQIVR